MKRVGLLILIVLFGLSACSDITTSNLQSYLKASASDASSEPANPINNISKGMYSYYLPAHVGRKTSTETSTILSSNNINILMNLDVIDVISNSYYDTSKTFKSMITSTSNLSSFDSDFINSSGVHVSFRVDVLKITDSLVLLTLESGYFIFTSITPISSSPEILYDMITIARTCKVDRDAVLLAYSTRESIVYQKETLDMFSQIAPESGTVLDMISGGKPIDIPDGTIE